MLTVVGLGNPGNAYRHTRHNVGYMVLDHLVEHPDESGFDSARPKMGALRRLTGATAFRKKRLYAECEVEVDGTPVMLVKPLTFMNQSGKAVASLKTSTVIRSFDEMLVVTDDVDLDCGRLRIRAKGSAGGHNGLRSVIHHTGTTEFPRLKIGVGPRPAGEELVDYVLGSFTPDQRESIEQALPAAVRILAAWARGGLHEAHREASQ